METRLHLRCEDAHNAALNQHHVRPWNLGNAGPAVSWLYACTDDSLLTQTLGC
jgi:hypothetical protein